MVERTNPNAGERTIFTIDARGLEIFPIIQGFSPNGDVVTTIAPMNGANPNFNNGLWTLNRNVTVAEGPDLSQQIQQMLNFAQQVNDAKISYRPFGPRAGNQQIEGNCNCFTAGALAAAGLPPVPGVGLGW